MKVAVVSRGQGVLCGGDPLAGVSVGFVPQCPWEVSFNHLYSFIQRNSKIGFIWTILVCQQLDVKFRNAVIAVLCSLAVNWKCNCIFNIVIKKNTLFSIVTPFWIIWGTGEWRLRAGRSGGRISVGERFSAPVQTGPVAHPASYTMGTGSFPGVKWPGCGVDHPTPSSAGVKERVELYLYSPSGPSWAVIGWTLPFTCRGVTSTARHAARSHSFDYISTT